MIFQMCILKHPSPVPICTQHKYSSTDNTLEVVLDHIAQVVKLIHLTPLRARKNFTIIVTH